MNQLTKSAAWQALQAHHKTLARIQMRELFQQEPARFERFSLSLDDLLLDYSKNRVTTRTMTLLHDLARDAELEGWIERLFRGDRINTLDEFSALLIAQRSRIGWNDQDEQPTVPHASVTLQALARFEARIFGLALDAVFPVAGFHLLDRKKFLQCVIRVFFSRGNATVD